MVKIRLSRVGKKHVPFYRIVAVDSREKRDGASLESLGTVDGLNSKIVSMETERIDAWVAKGAVMTDTVKKLYKLYKKQATAAQ
jgi:small subunit ribosomal protein S16